MSETLKNEWVSDQEALQAYRDRAAASGYAPEDVELTYTGNRSRERFSSFPELVAYLERSGLDPDDVHTYAFIAEKIDPTEFVRGLVERYSNDPENRIGSNGTVPDFVLDDMLTYGINEMLKAKVSSVDLKRILGEFTEGGFLVSHLSDTIGEVYQLKGQ